MTNDYRDFDLRAMRSARSGPEDFSPRALNLVPMVVEQSSRGERAYDIYSRLKMTFTNILRDSCRIDYIIKDGNYMPGRDNYFRYTKRFDSWLTVRSKYRIDSLAIIQLEPIYTLEDFVKSLKLAFENEVKKGMSAVKIFTAYYRTLDFERVEPEAAKKVFRSLVNGEEDYVISYKDAKSLQDYMLHCLLDLADKYKLPVAFHTGLQAGKGKITGNSNPVLLTSLFIEYPDINFVLYHGTLPPHLRRPSITTHAPTILQHPAPPPPPPHLCYT